MEILAFIARNAPAIPTAVYTIPFTKRVAGFVMEEKKVALKPYIPNLELISSNCA